MADTRETSPNGSKWLTVPEACQALGVSERTLRRHIDQGKYETQLEKGRRLVCLSVEGDRVTADTQADRTMTAQLRSEIEHLRDMVSERDRQIQQLMAELTEANQQRNEADRRSDTIILQLTKQTERLSEQLTDGRNQLEDLRTERKRKRPWTQWLRH